MGKKKFVKPHLNYFVLKFDRHYLFFKGLCLYAVIIFETIIIIIISPKHGMQGSSIVVTSIQISVTKVNTNFLPGQPFLGVASVSFAVRIFQTV